MAIEYKNGTIVECPDFDSDENRQCGGGLHLSARPKEALYYNKGKLKVCEVFIKDIVVYPHDISKVRCKKVFVVDDYKEEIGGENQPC